MKNPRKPHWLVCLFSWKYSHNRLVYLKGLFILILLICNGIHTRNSLKNDLIYEISTTCSILSKSRKPSKRKRKKDRKTMVERSQGFLWTWTVNMISNITKYLTSFKHQLLKKVQERKQWFLYTWTVIWNHIWPLTKFGKTLKHQDMLCTSSDRKNNYVFAPATQLISVNSTYNNW